MGAAKIKAVELPPQISEADQQALDKLKSDIEALSAAGRILWSRGALTPRLTQHIVFANGAEKPETQAPAFLAEASVVDLCAMTLIAVTAYRQKFEGPVDLIWRREPSLDSHWGGGKIAVSVRLCFEPTLVQVASGVWVEERLTRTGPSGLYA